MEYQEVIANGDNIKYSMVKLSLMEISVKCSKWHYGQKEHPGLFNKGHIGFLGHDSVVKFRNIRIKGGNICL